MAESPDRDSLIEENAEFVSHMAKKLIRELMLPVSEMDELVAAGYLGLVEAAERFDSRYGNNFTTFAYLRIRGAMLDHCRKASKHSRKAFEKIKQYEAANQLVADRVELYLEEESLDEATDFSLGEVMECMADSTIAVLLDQNIAAENNSYIVDSIEKTAIENTPAFILRKLIATLPEKERSLIEGFYFEDKSFTEICSEMDGVSKSWASRIHARTLAKLKKAYLKELARVEKEG